MAGVEESSRKRVALAVLLVGIVLILIGAGAILYQLHLVAMRDPGFVPPAAGGSLPVAVVIQRVLFLLLLLVLVFCVATLAFMRFSRRFRQWLFRRPLPPTPADDVWVTHRLPPDLDGPDLKGDTGEVSSPPDEPGPSRN